jgi:endonuclease/exonuclease/phosphatase family metal-dependent hydrolase
LKRLNIFNKFIFLLNSIGATLLLLSYILPFLPPKTFSLLSILSLAVPFLLAINFIFGLYWLIRLKRQFILSAVVLTLGFSHIKSSYRFNTPSETNADGVKVMSYNVRLLNYYNWIDSDNIPNQIQQFVTNQNPDFFCVQEYQSSIAKPLPFPYVFSSPKTVKSELVIFSKFPFFNSGTIPFPNSANSAIFADFIINTDTIRLYNVHLQSSGVNTNIEDLDSETSDLMINQLSQTFKKQQTQAELLTEHMKQSPFSILLCGDFNNTAHSYVYRLLKSNLQDTFQVAGRGFGRTYAMDYYPARIDFILVDSEIKVNNYKTHPEEFSDHFPISASLNLP